MAAAANGLNETLADEEAIGRSADELKTAAPHGFGILQLVTGIKKLSH